MSTSIFDLEAEDTKRNGYYGFCSLMRLVSSYPVYLLTGIFLIIVGIVTTLLEPRIIGYIIDEAIIPENRGLLNTASSIFLLITAIRVISVAGQNYYFEVLGQHVTQNLRIKLFTHFQKMPIAIFDNYPSGRLLTRATNDIASLNEMFSAGFVSMLGNLCLVFGTLISMYILDLKLGLITTAVFPLLVYASIYFSRRLKLAYIEARNRLSAVNAFMAENLLGMKVVHLFNRQKLHMEKFNHLNEEYAVAQGKSIKIFALFQPTITICAGVSMGIAIWWGGGQVVAGSLKIGVLVAFFAYIFALFQPIREIADKWNTFLSGMASADRIFSLLDWPTEVELSEKDPILPLLDLKGDIVFENVWFSYKKDCWILQDFSLHIRAGQKVGVVGYTGAGKTTLINLLMRFYDPQKGRILLDGKDLREYPKRSLRSSIGLVQQDVFLFSGSVKENITFWNSVFNSKKNLLGPLELSTVEELLSHLGHKAEDPLFERGNNLSMGERQILAFARALIARPQLWILDEASAHLDSQTEEVLQKVFQKHSLGQTTLLIAHRLATVQSADLIIVLHKGKLLEKGNHDELLAQNGLYSKLYQYQRAQRESHLHREVSTGNQVVNAMSDSSA